VDEVHVFGSFARGALEPHDVDVAVEFTFDEEFAAQCAWDLSRGRDPFAGLRRALTGGSRGVQFQFQELKNLHGDGIATTLLWRRGEALPTALERLEGIKPDPQAGRAERDHMLPAFEGIDRWVPLPVRTLLADWSKAAAVQVQQVQLPDQKVRDRHARQVIDERWIPTSPLRRAGTNTVAYFETLGYRARTIHLHGQDVDERDTPHFIGFRWRYIATMHRCLTHWGGDQWLEVPHPTPHQPMTGVLLTVRDRAALEQRPDRP
jgi:hypothetical protein